MLFCDSELPRVPTFPETRGVAGGDMAGPIPMPKVGPTDAATRPHITALMGGLVTASKRYIMPVMGRG